MADAKVSALTSYSNPDPVNDVIPIVDNTNSQTKKISRNNLLGITSTPVGINDSQTLTTKTLTAPAINSPVLGGTITGTYTLAGTPTFPAAVVTLTGSQTLTNKVLTSPTINTPTITNASITQDAVTGFSSANTGTVYGIAVTASKIPGTSITNSTVGANQLNTGAQSATIATAETTTSIGTFVDLTTPGPAVTVTIGVNGLALVIITASMQNGTANDYAVMGYAVSGANTIAATSTKALFVKEITTAGDRQNSAMYLLTGLAAGSTTFTAKYEVLTGGTATFLNRSIAVIPL